MAPWFINEVVSMFPETTLLKEPSMFWEWAILLAVQATLLCTAAKLVVPERLLAQAAGLLDMIRIVALIVVFSELRALYMAWPYAASLRSSPSSCC